VLKRGGGAAAPLVRGPGGAPAIARATSPLPHYATSSGVGGRGDLVFGSQSAPAAAIGPGGVPGGSRQLFSSPNSVMGPQLAMAARGGGLGAILALLRGYRGAGGGGSRSCLAGFPSTALTLRCGGRRLIRSWEVRGADV
jgi:hypothetical protein